MRLLVTWCMMLGMGVCGMALSDALSWERWAAPVQVAGETVLDQEIRPATSPVLRSRFARPAPRGWAAPSLVEARGRLDEMWRPGLAQLGLPVAAQAPRLGVGPAGATGLSMELGVEARAVPLPRVRLVKDVLEAMPDMCDERIFGGKWYCDIMCGIGGCHHYSEMKLKREVDAEGYQIISWEEKSIDTDHHFHARWIVDRKWHPTGKGEWYARGRPQVALSCNGKSDSGHSVLSVNYQHPNGHKRLQIRIYIDKDGAMTFDQYDVWKEKGNGKIHKEPYGARRCRRSFEEFP